MLSEIVCSGARQKYRTTKGGTMATHATTTQFVTDPIPTTIATRKTAIDQATNSSVLVFSVIAMSVATGHRARCTELHAVVLPSQSRGAGLRDLQPPCSLLLI